MTLDVDKIRAQYPALSDGYSYLDGAAGTQLPSSVIEAISSAYTAGLANVGGAFPASQRSGEITDECRHAIADLVGGDRTGVILGPNMTTLTYRLAGALSAGWAPGDEIVVSRLDHDANVRPWVQAAASAGVVVRWAEVDLRTGELPVGQYDDLLSDRTRLLAVTAASNVLGTRPDVARHRLTSAHGSGALTYVDGVHWTPHGPVDVVALGADFYATSAYKWSGPHIGAVIAAPDLLETLHPDKLAPSSDVGAVAIRAWDAGVRGPRRRCGGCGASPSLDSSATGSRRERISAPRWRPSRSTKLLLFPVALGRATGRCPTSRCYGTAAPPGADGVLQRRRPLREVAEHLAGRRINVWNGDNYAWELAGALGIRESGGAVRAGLVHYNDESDVGRLLEAVAEL